MPQVLNGMQSKAGPDLSSLLLLPEGTGLPTCGSENSHVGTRTLSPRLGSTALCPYEVFGSWLPHLQNKLPAHMPCALGTVDIGVQNPVALGPCSQPAVQSERLIGNHGYRTQACDLNTWDLCWGNVEEGASKANWWARGY